MRWVFVGWAFKYFMLLYDWFVLCWLACDYFGFVVLLVLSLLFAVVVWVYFCGVFGCCVLLMCYGLSCVCVVPMCC